MLTQSNINARMFALSHTTSDLLVGLKCLDVPEVEREARMLNEQANEYGASQLGLTALQIEQAAIAGDLNAAQLLVPVIHENLLQTREAMNKLLPQPFCLPEL